MTSDALQYAVLAWLATDTTGISSKTIAFTVLGIDYEDACHPWDPADLKRCKDLLDRIPELRVHLDKLRAISPIWNSMINRWDEMEKLLERERFQHGNRAPDTWALMKEIIGEHT